MSLKRKAQIKAWQLASVNAHGGHSGLFAHQGSYSSPHLGEPLGFSGRKQRTIKFMGKSALKHTGGSVTPAPWVSQILGAKHGKGVPAKFANPKDFAPSTLVGDIIPARGGGAFRKRHKSLKPPKSHKSAKVIYSSTFKAGT